MKSVAVNPGGEPGAKTSEAAASVGAGLEREPGVTLGELAAEAGVSPLELVTALIEARLVTVEAYASASGLGTGEPGGVLRVTVSEAELRTWLSGWARRRDG